MAYLIYDPEEQHVVQQLSYNPLDDVAIKSTTTIKVFEGTVDEENDFITNYRLNAAGDGLENPYAGQSKADQLIKFQEDQDKIRAVKRLPQLINEVKTQCKKIIEDGFGSSSWKVEKAQEDDLINGNNDAMRALALEKKAIRDKNNAVEAEIQALDISTVAGARAILSYDVQAKMTE
ncbi:MAG: hypothetical protein CMM99_00660 [Rickettsiales bacterium]|nr:hypothetical protein [Rickettsiales bacterium]|tara:strand:- start:198 stop:728 length:531 start_codon:yes stop_codon:yes gene_type:complete